MNRTAERELMDAPAHALAYARADFSAPHDAFVQGFAERFPGFVAGKVLDLGCGPADISVRFARRYPEASLTAVDAAPAMLALARERLIDEGLTARIRLLESYLPDARLATRKFDVVMANSLLHHLADPAALWSLIAAQHGATLIYIVDLVRPGDEAELARLVETYAADEDPLLVSDFTSSLRAAYRPEEIHAQLRAAELALNVEVISDRHIAIWGTR